MENQLNDQPLKWIERIKRGLDVNKGYFISNDMLTESVIRSIFTNIREREQSLKNFVDMDVLFDSKDCLLRLGANSWKLITKNSSYYSNLNAIKKLTKFNDSPKHGKSTGNFFSLFNELENVKDKLKESLGKHDKGSGNFNSFDSKEWYPTIINIILECNKVLLSILKYLGNTKSFRKNWIKRNNIRKYKINNTWILDSDWNKLSLFQKIMKRWNFSDKHQCLVPWEEKKLTKQELLQFQEAKIKWRIKRKNELNGDIFRMKIFEKFCHARIINDKLVQNLDMTYDESMEVQSKLSNNTRVRKNQIKEIHAN